MTYRPLLWLIYTSKLAIHHVNGGPWKGVPLGKSDLELVLVPWAFVLIKRDSEQLLI